jgi:hypothetical protein
MGNTANLSRRAFVGGITLAPNLLGTKVSTPDDALVRLGCEFDRLTQIWDDWAYQTKNTYENVDILGLIAKLDPIEAAIVSKRANTLDGLMVKARAANWSCQGRISPEKEASTDKRMAWSIVRDLLELSQGHGTT